MIVTLLDAYTLSLQSFCLVCGLQLLFSFYVFLFSCHARVIVVSHVVVFGVCCPCLVI